MKASLVPSFYSVTQLCSSGRLAGRPLRVAGTGEVAWSEVLSSEDGQDEDAGRRGPERCPAEAADVRDVCFCHIASREVSAGMS